MRLGFDGAQPHFRGMEWGTSAMALNGLWAMDETKCKKDERTGDLPAPRIDPDH